VSFLLFDGRQNETTFEMMNSEGAFPRLLELIQAQRKNGVDGDGPETGLHRMLMELLYEMSRIQRIKIEDLGGFLYVFHRVLPSEEKIGVREQRRVN
jgi:hypothetical protein